MTTIVSFLRRHKYWTVCAASALLLALGISGSFGSTVELEPGEMELTAGGTVAGKCMILNPREVVCVPAKTPKGSPMTVMYEDGSAKYKNGSIYGSNGKFR